MTQNSRNARRIDPYKNFRFRLKWDGRHVAGVTVCSALKRTTEVARHRDRDSSVEGKAPRMTGHEAITLERGVIHDAAFDNWATKTSTLGSRRGTGVPKDLRKNVSIEVYDEAGRLAIVYKVFGCWVSEYQSLPDLDASANAVSIQTLKLENEGWERDDVVAEPTEPAFNEPATRRNRA